MNCSAHMRWVFQYLSVIDTDDHFYAKSDDNSVKHSHQICSTLEHLVDYRRGLVLFKRTILSSSASS